VECGCDLELGYRCGQLRDLPKSHYGLVVRWLAGLLLVCGFHTTRLTISHLSLVALSLIIA
jgi:hypothetical protein